MSALVNSPGAAPQVEAGSSLYAAYDHFVRMAQDTFGTAASAREWLDTPNEEFDNQTPLDYARARKFDPKIFDTYFIQVQHGVYR